LFVCRYVRKRSRDIPHLSPLPSEKGEEEASVNKLPFFMAIDRATFFFFLAPQRGERIEVRGR